MANGFLKGTVFDSTTSNPIYVCKDGMSKPHVKITNTSDTDFIYEMDCVNGQYAFYVPEGTYSMKVTCYCYATRSKAEIGVPGYGTKTVNIYLQAKTTGC